MDHAEGNHAEGNPVGALDRSQVARLLTTTRSVRRRLDLERPVAREVVVECIRLAVHAPNASNAQEWRWVVVDDPDQRRRVGEHYRAATAPVVSRMLEAKLARGDQAGARISRSILYLAEHMAEVPILVVPCFDVPAARARYGTLIGSDAAPEQMAPDMYASIYPAVWSFQLALRSRGLGSTLTTAHQSDPDAMASILGIPRGWFQAAILPVAHIAGPEPGPAPRGPVQDLIIWNHAGAEESSDTATTG